MKVPSLLLVAWLSGALLSGQEWQPLFNGRDLSGWVPVNVAPGTFTVREGIIVSTGKPTGVMRTDRQYENFELELEWKHIVKGGNAGLFVWSYPVTAPGVPFTKSIEVQILDGRNSETHTSHGDIFSIHGARMKPDRPHPKGAERCLPSEWRAKPAGEWNHYRVVCKDGVIKLAVNGKVVSGGSECTPRKGYICLESEGSECHFRNIRIRELPSSNPRPEETAPVADGFVSIYNGLNFNGWKMSDENARHWKVEDWILDHDGRSAGSNPHLWTDRSYGDFVLICDWRWKDKSKRHDHGVVLLRGSNQAAVTTRGAKPAGQWNRLLVTLKGQRLTVQQNDQTVTENQLLGGLPSEGPIGLMQAGQPIQFANIYVKPLDD